MLSKPEILIQSPTETISIEDYPTQPIADTHGELIRGLDIDNKPVFNISKEESKPDTDHKDIGTAKKTIATKLGVSENSVWINLLYAERGIYAIANMPCQQIPYSMAALNEKFMVEIRSMDDSGRFNLSWKSKNTLTATLTVGMNFVTFPNPSTSKTNQIKVDVIITINSEDGIRAQLTRKTTAALHLSKEVLTKMQSTFVSNKQQGDVGNAIRNALHTALQAKTLPTSFSPAKDKKQFSLPHTSSPPKVKYTSTSVDKDGCDKLKQAEILREKYRLYLLQADKDISTYSLSEFKQLAGTSDSPVVIPILDIQLFNKSILLADYVLNATPFPDVLATLISEYARDNFLDLDDLTTLQSNYPKLFPDITKIETPLQSKTFYTFCFKIFNILEIFKLERLSSLRTLIFPQNGDNAYTKNAKMWHGVDDSQHLRFQCFFDDIAAFLEYALIRVSVDHARALLKLCKQTKSAEVPISTSDIATCLKILKLRCVHIEQRNDHWMLFAPATAAYRVALSIPIIKYKEHSKSKSKELSAIESIVISDTELDTTKLTSLLSSHQQGNPDFTLMQQQLRAQLEKPPTAGIQVFESLNPSQLHAHKMKLSSQPNWITVNSFATTVLLRYQKNPPPKYERNTLETQKMDFNSRLGVDILRVIYNGYDGYKLWVCIDQIPSAKAKIEKEVQDNRTYAAQQNRKDARLIPNKILDLLKIPALSFMQSQFIIHTHALLNTIEWDKPELAIIQKGINRMAFMKEQIRKSSFNSQLQQLTGKLISISNELTTVHHLNDEHFHFSLGKPEDSKLSPLQALIQLQNIKR